MDRCKTCKHWAPCASSIAHWGNDKKAGGICSSDKIVEDYGQGHGADMMVYPYAEGGEFWTGPDFGCVHHQQAEYHPESQGHCFTTELCNAIDAARAAVDNPPANAWQPIETAPRDGTWVLLAGGECEFHEESDNKGRVVTGRWTIEFRSNTRDPLDEEFGCWQFAWYDSGVYGEYENPTHWQPLPSPPPMTPSAPHAFTEGQSITVDGNRAFHAHLNGTYVVDSVNSDTITP